MSDDAQKTADKALDLFVYAPVGVALYLRACIDDDARYPTLTTF